jgi:hypothetical protein
MRYLDIAITQVSTFGALVAVVAGHLYITEGYGLHPILAGAVATLLVAGPYLVPKERELW